MTRIVLYLLGLCLLLTCLNSSASGSRRSLKASAVESEPLNLRDFGAVGNGIADDGPAFQRALDALAAAGGGTLFVPAGKYAIATPVAKDFTGLAASITIIGVESLTPVAPPSAPGSELSKGLDLLTEVYPRTGDHQIAFLIKGLRGLLIKDIAFVGTPTVVTDAQNTLLLADIEKAQIIHSEFYGLATLTGEGIVQAIRSDLEIAKCKFLGSTATSGYYLPIVQNLDWYGITVTDTTFLDYGQRPDFFSKTGIAAPISWINIGDAAQTTNLSPRREVVLRNVFFDEGGYWGLSSLPYRYDSQGKPIDLIYITGLEMNVSNFGQFGHWLYDVQRVFIEKSRYGWSHLAAAAIGLNNVGSAILDQVTCEAAADHIYADSRTGVLTVINSSFKQLDSAAGTTNTINTTAEADPVQYVRSRFATALGREPDPAAHFYWSDLLVHCFEDLACQDNAKQALNNYLNTSPSPKFKISGRIATPQNIPVAGVTVELSGSQSVSATTDSNGNYVFANLPTSGRYVVTPTATDYNFDAVTITTPSRDQVANFTTRPKTYVVQGTVRSGGNPLPGVTVALSGSALGTAVTDGAGKYSFELQKGGNYVLTPVKANYTFGPTTASGNDISADAQVDFTATLNKHSIVGRVLNPAGSPIAGVMVTLTGSVSITTTTAADGTYSFSNLDAGTTWNVRAAKDHFALSPPVQTFNDLTANQVADFEGVQLPVLLTAVDSDRAVALDLIQFLPEPFSLTTTLLTEGRNRTRIIVFATDLNLLPGEGIEALVAEAEDAQHVSHPLRVEFVSTLPELPNLSQVVIRLSQDLDNAGDVLISLRVRGLTSNKARIAVGSVSDDPN